VKVCSIGRSSRAMPATFCAPQEGGPPRSGENLSNPYLWLKPCEAPNEFLERDGRRLRSTHLGPVDRFASEGSSRAFHGHGPQRGSALNRRVLGPPGSKGPGARGCDPTIWPVGSQGPCSMPQEELERRILVATAIRAAARRGLGASKNGRALLCRTAAPQLARSASCPSSNHSAADSMTEASYCSGWSAPSAATILGSLAPEGRRNDIENKLAGNREGFYDWRVGRLLG